MYLVVVTHVILYLNLLPANNNASHACLMAAAEPLLRSRVAHHSNHRFPTIWQHAPGHSTMAASSVAMYRRQQIALNLHRRRLWRGTGHILGDGKAAADQSRHLRHGRFSPEQSMSRSSNAPSLRGITSARTRINIRCIACDEDATALICALSTSRMCPVPSPKSPPVKTSAICFFDASPRMTPPWSDVRTCWVVVNRPRQRPSEHAWEKVWVNAKKFK